jgi:excisionase family DNA binding protein
LIDAKAAACMLSMSTRRLAQLVAGGSVPSVKVGGLRRFRPEDLLKWVQAGCPLAPARAAEAAPETPLHATVHKGGAA